MRTLITGANGFAGRHLLRELQAHDYTSLALDLTFRGKVEGAHQKVAVDLCDTAGLRAAIKTLRPDSCIHLGAMSFVPDGVQSPEKMLAVNVAGTMSLLDLLAEYAPGARVVMVSTSQVYGMAPADSPVTEDTPMRPQNMYAISKAAADLASLAYTQQRDLDIMIARPSNHTGPGQASSFVVASFVDQVRRMARGEADPILHVGNMESRRDFMDVRDVVRAYRLLLEKGTAGQAYNISCGSQHQIGEVLEMVCELAGVEPEVQVDASLYRPTDATPLLDSSLIRTTTGWTPKIPLEQTIRNMLEHP